MSVKKKSSPKKSAKRQRSKKSGKQQAPATNKQALDEHLKWFLPDADIFSQHKFHGNTKWQPDQLARQAIMWSWLESKNVTDCFEQTLKHCEKLGDTETAHSYTSFMNALTHHQAVFTPCLRDHLQALMPEIGGRFWREDGWVLIGFDGSRSSAPRTKSNEQALCAPNHGQGKTAKYRKKQTKGMRRAKNEKNPSQPPKPQAWITKMWHMNLRLPYAWRLGPSNSSERAHVMEMLRQEKFPKKTLFCGDAGFVGYGFWRAILASGRDFLIRVGGNVRLLSQYAKFEKCQDGTVLCWPKQAVDNGEPPLRLRLVKVKLGKTNVWILTSVLDKKQLTKKQIIRYYKMRWGIEVEFRGLKQTLDKATLRCRNSQRLLVELDWSILGMAVAELLALKEQLADCDRRSSSNDDDYTPQDRSLAETMRALRGCLSDLNETPVEGQDLTTQLRQAVVQRYDPKSPKHARYRPKNPDKKPLGEPEVRKLNAREQKKLTAHEEKIAA